MTYKEAFEVCRDLPPTNYSEACKKALEKQIPKIITHTATLKMSCTCPNCGNCLDKFEKFGESIIRVRYQYCHFCGQALDWDE